MQPLVLGYHFRLMIVGGLICQSTQGSRFQMTKKNGTTVVAISFFSQIGDINEENRKKVHLYKFVLLISLIEWKINTKNVYGRN